MATGVEAERKAASGRMKEEDLLKALPARSANREVRVGLFVLVGIVAFLTILFTMTDVGTFRGRYYANTVVVSAGGMRRGDPVQMRGVNIGRVIDFDIVQRGVGVKMEIYDEYQIPEDSRAQVKSNGLLGGMVVDIVPGRSSKRMADGATLPGVADSNDIMAQAAGIGSRADTALMRVNMLLSDETIGGVGQTVGSVSTSAEELQALLNELNGIATQQRGQLSALSASLRRSAAGVEAATAGPELQRSIQQVDALTARMAQTTESLNRTSASLQAVISRLERGEGTLGKLSSDEQLYNNLNATVNNLNALITDIQQNPKKYISVSVF
jgi:phospholipid/cholesterol/gamma-HCH transport system substrate-binding protein